MEKMNYDYEIRPDLRKFRLSSAEKERATAALLEHHYNNKVWKLVSNESKA